MNDKVTVLGAGLAGCEAALWLAGKGVQVDLYEQKPVHFSPAHKSAGIFGAGSIAPAKSTGCQAPGSIEITKSTAGISGSCIIDTGNSGIRSTATGKNGRRLHITRIQA